MVDATTRRTGSLLKAGALAAVVSVVLNHFLQAGALALFEIPDDFSPLHGPGPVIFFSVIGAVTGVGVFAGIAGVSARPISIFRIVAGVVLVLSFIPDLWLLTESGGANVPGGTPAGVGTLMLMHVVSAAAVVWAVERGS